MTLKHTRHFARAIPMAGGVLVLAGLACGPLGALSGTQATLESAATTLEAVAPTLQAVAPTLEAAMPTLEAAAPTLEAAAAGGVPIRQWAASVIASSQYGDTDWSASQAAGAPNSLECLDLVTAWASYEASGLDWLELHYATPVVPSEINIYQNYNPGAVSRVEVIGVDGTRVTVYEVPPITSALAQCPAVIPVSVVNVASPVNTVVLTVDQTQLNMWSEVDAVELVGTP